MTLRSKGIGSQHRCMVGGIGAAQPRAKRRLDSGTAMHAARGTRSPATARCSVSVLGWDWGSGFMSLRAIAPA